MSGRVLKSLMLGGGAFIIGGLILLMVVSNNSQQDRHTACVKALQKADGLMYQYLASLVSLGEGQDFLVATNNLSDSTNQQDQYIAFRDACLSE